MGSKKWLVDLKVLFTYVEEFVGALLEPVALAIVDEHCTLIDNRHLSEALLRIHECVQCSSSHASDEEADDRVVLVHVLLGLALLS